MRSATTSTLALTLARFEAGENVGVGLCELLDERQVDAAVVISAIGSLAHVGYRTVDLNSESIACYSTLRQISGAFEIAALQGHLGRAGSGLPQLHLHGAFVTSDGTLVGGHVVEAYALVTVEVGLLTGPDVQWLRVQDGCGLPIFEPRPSTTRAASGVRSPVPTSKTP